MPTIVKRRDVNIELIKSIDAFLMSQKTPLNKIYISSAWANRMFELYGIESEWTIYYLKKEIIALHLVFNEFRGVMRFSNYHPIVKKLIHPIIKKFFPYKIWKIPLLIDLNISRKLKVQIEKDFEDRISKFKNIRHSPIEGVYAKKNNDSQKEWATYIFDFKSKTYDKIFSKYKRSLKRSLNRWHKGGSLECKRLDFLNYQEVEKFSLWAGTAQKNTGKSFIYDTNSLLDTSLSFSEQGYIYEIFILKLMDNDAILGSLTIYGDSCYVTEAEANTSIEAKLLGVHVHDLLRDSIVKFCFENNIRFYDLAGFNPRRRSSNKELGIKFSKSKFNAQEYKYLILNK